VNPSDVIILLATTATAAGTATATATWSLVSGTFVGGLSFNEARGSAASYEVVASSTKNTNLVFPGGVLVGGSSYTLKLSAFYESASDTGS
ncbi:unnamed protein product, partial [Phaeothamnion confervicola]